MVKIYSLIFILFFSYAYAYEKIYYEDEEYTLRHIIRDYSYIDNYNHLWQQVSKNVDIEFYDTFIDKDFTTMPAKKARDEAVNFIRNYKIKTGTEHIKDKEYMYPSTNILILQNKALLKARRVLEQLPIHEKTSLVYLAAALSYIYSDGLYEFDKLQKLLKEWMRLGSEDFPDITQEEREKRSTLFTYIVNMHPDPYVSDEFINIIKSQYYNILLFRCGFFDLFNIAEYQVVNGREVSAGINLVSYFTEYIRPDYMDIVVNKPFRLDAFGKKVNHYFTVYKKEDNLNKILDNFYIFPFNKQTFVLHIMDEEDKILFYLYYFNPNFIHNPEYSLIKVDKYDKSAVSIDLWQFSRARNKVINSFTASPSFECNSNVNLEKATICESYVLRMLDKISSKKYYEVYESVKKNKKKLAHLSSLKDDFKITLSGCNIDKLCMKSAYESYIDSLISIF